MLTSHLPNPSFPGLRGGSTRPLSGGGCPRLSRVAMHGQVLVRCLGHQAGGLRHDFQSHCLHSTDAEAPQHHLVRVGVRVRVRIGVRVRVELPLYLGLGLGAGARPSSSPGSSPGRGVSPPQRPWQEHQLAVRAPYQAYQQRHPARVADLRRAWSGLRLGLGSGLGSGG